MKSFFITCVSPLTLLADELSVLEVDLCRSGENAVTHRSCYRGQDTVTLFRHEECGFSVVFTHPALIDSHT